MKILNLFIETSDYKNKTERLLEYISETSKMTIFFENKVRDLKAENKKLRSENYALKCRIRKKKREKRKPIIDKACKMAKELAVEIPFVGDVK